MGCNHKKEKNWILWCNTCAIIAAGPKPACKWRYGDYAREKRGNDNICKVLDSKMILVGTATETPSWSEDLIFEDGSGTASLYNKMKFVKAD